MAYRVNEEACIGCGACVSECMAHAIEEKDGIVVINDKCVECDACILVCPLDAIVKD